MPIKAFVVISTTDRAFFFFTLNEFQNMLPHKRISQAFHRGRVETKYFITLVQCFLPCFQDFIQSFSLAGPLKNFP